jgi:guanylate kinase
MKGIILYGPPASGKDTITEALTKLDPQCAIFERLKATPDPAVGPTKTSTYRLTDKAELLRLQSQGLLAWLNRRYGSIYAIDIRGLRSHLRRGIPVVHLGQPEAVSAVKAVAPDATWLVVSLTCPREVAEARLRARDSDVASRLEAWDETPRFNGADVEIDTEQTRPIDAARTILRAVTGGVPGVPGVPETL